MTSSPPLITALCPMDQQGCDGQRESTTFSSELDMAGDGEGEGGRRRRGHDKFWKRAHWVLLARSHSRNISPTSGLCFVGIQHDWVLQKTLQSPVSPSIAQVPPPSLFLQKKKIMTLVRLQSTVAMRSFCWFPSSPRHTGHFCFATEYVRVRGSHAKSRPSSSTQVPTISRHPRQQ